MKKILVIIVFLITLLIISANTYATTTVFLGKTVNGSQSYDDSTVTNSALTGNYDSNIISIDYIKKIKIGFDYEYGQFNNDNGNQLTLQSYDLRAGYPIFKNKKWIIYFAGEILNFSEYNEFYYPIKIEANGGLLGFDIVSTPSERWQLELDLRDAIGGSYQLVEYGTDTPLNLLTYKLKIQYNLSYNFGLVLDYHSMSFSETDSDINVSQNLSCVAVGLIYKF